MRKPLIRFVGGALTEIDERWAERKRFSEDSIQKILEKAKPAPKPEYDATPAKHTAKITALVLAEY